MSLIDWSDPQEMFGLLVDYVADERGGAKEAERRTLLSRLKLQLEELQESFESMTPEVALRSLRAIIESMPDEFETDPVTEHLSACVEELERLYATGPEDTWEPR